MLPWIQVDFHTPTRLTGVVTQGRPTTREEWVEVFKIQYGNNQTDMATIQHRNGTDIVSISPFITIKYSMAERKNIDFM